MNESDDEEEEDDQQWFTYNRRYDCTELIVASIVIESQQLTEKLCAALQYPPPHQDNDNNNFLLVLNCKTTPQTFDRIVSILAKYIQYTTHIQIGIDFVIANAADTSTSASTIQAFFACIMEGIRKYKLRSIVEFLVTTGFPASFKAANATLAYFNQGLSNILLMNMVAENENANANAIEIENENGGANNNVNTNMNRVVNTCSIAISLPLQYLEMLYENEDSRDLLGNAIRTSTMASVFSITIECENARVFTIPHLMGVSQCQSIAYILECIQHNTHINCFHFRFSDGSISILDQNVFKATVIAYAADLLRNKKLTMIKPMQNANSNSNSNSNSNANAIGIDVNKMDFGLNLCLSHKQVNRASMAVLLAAMNANTNLNLSDLVYDRTGIIANATELRDGLCAILDNYEQHRLKYLEISFVFVSEYSFGQYKIEGFQELSQCLVNKPWMELETLRIRTIMEPELYQEYILAIILKCNTFLSHIEITFDEYNIMNESQVWISCFLEHLEIFYHWIRFVHTCIAAVFPNVVVHTLLDYCKLRTFEVTLDVNDEPNKNEMQNARSEFKHDLVLMLRRIQFESQLNMDSAEEINVLYDMFVKYITVDGIKLWVADESPTCLVSMVI